jgi:hypothetical protein
VLVANLFQVRQHANQSIRVPVWSLFLNLMTFEDIAVKIKQSIFCLIFRMKVWRIMVIVEHSDDDSKKSGNYWHSQFS